MLRSRRKPRGGVFQQRFRGEHGEDLRRIVFPVGRHMQIAAGLQAGRQQMHQRGLQQSPLVMALFRPRVGEKNMDAGEAAFSEHVGDDFDCVVLDDADVGELLRVDQPQQAADTGRVDLDADVIVFRMGSRRLRGALTHAEADFEESRRGALECHVEIAAGRRIGNAELRQQAVDRAALRVGDAALAQDEAADRALWSVQAALPWLAGAISPPVGEDGAAA